MSVPSIGIDRERSALLLVDLQPDFLPGGALAVDEGDQILAPIARLMDKGLFGHYVATQDWHPPGHISFASSHAGHKPMDTVDLYEGHPQTLWPDHCVQGTPGAELAPQLNWNPVSAVIRKGMDADCDSYSGFRNNWNSRGERPPTGLASYLEGRGVEVIFVCGLARDVCALWTAEDGAEAEFETKFIWDATRPVQPEANDKVREKLDKAGVAILTLEQLGIGV